MLAGQPVGTPLVVGTPVTEGCPVLTSLPPTLYGLANGRRSDLVVWIFQISLSPCAQKLANSFGICEMSRIQPAQSNPRAMFSKRAGQISLGCRRCRRRAA
jgi:hypothetical protein